MNDELNNLHDTVSNLLSNGLHNWGDALTQAASDHDDNKFLSTIQALLTIRNVLTPLVSGQTTSTPPEGAGHG
ncbi:hypothetical protein ACUHMQ_05740 [Chitinimonas sp. PSY-7]|uniref:hypothetical protein n=1 Tax=Chitinimonas sp. PSY-7 TaxID=3459088 RepID=UPI0040402A36